jgi:dolichol kinase
MERRLFHVVACLTLSILALVIPRDTFLWLLFALASLLLLVDIVRLIWFATNRLFLWVFRSLIRRQETHGLTGSIYVLVGCLLTVLLFDRDIAVAGMIFLGVGDAFAGMIGERWGRHRILSKSLEGTASFFVSSVVVGLIFKYTALDISWMVLILGALSAAIVELLPLPVNDNLAIPLLSTAIMTGLALLN